MNVAREMPLIKERAILLKALSNPVRLCMVKRLTECESCNVSTMQECLQLSQSTASQHLGKLRDLGIIVGERRGTEVHYSIFSEEAVQIIKVLFPLS